MRPSSYLFWGLMFAFLIGASPSGYTDETLKLYGTWMSVNDPTPCLEENLGEGVDFLIIAKNKLGFGLATCSESNVWKDGKTFKLSAGCEGPEVGIQTILLDIKILSKDRILVNDKNTYARCKINVSID